MNYMNNNVKDETKVIKEFPCKYNPYIFKACLLAYKNSESPKNYRQKYLIYYKDDTTCEVECPNFDPVSQNTSVSFSDDGEYIFIPNYEAGVLQIKISTGEKVAVIKAKHVFCICVCDSVLTCLCRESKRRVLLYDWKVGTEIGEVPAAGFRLSRISKNCIAFKKSDTLYSFIYLDEPKSVLTVKIQSLYGKTDSAFQIIDADFLNGVLKMKFYCSDDEKVGRIVESESTISCTPKITMFFENGIGGKMI